MGIWGSLEEGLRGTRDIILAKSVIDAFAAMIMAASYGLGVLFSGIGVFVYQGLLVVGPGRWQTCSPSPSSRKSPPWAASSSWA